MEKNFDKKVTSPQFNNYPPHSYMKDFKDEIKFEQFSRKECVNYMHIPYCNRRCGYCILSSVIRDASKLDAEIDLLKKEIDLYSPNVADREIIAALWGGGTPSLLSPDQVMNLYGYAQSKLNFSPKAEITVEVKPDTISTENLEAFKACGANRLSFGVQSLNENELKYCNRDNTVDVLYNSINIATKSGITNLNFDIMIGLPGQTVESFKETCRKAFSILEPNHVSLYILIVHPKTYFYRLQQQEPHLFDSDENVTRMYDTFFEEAEKYGYVATSTLNVAKKSELRSQYQFNNWKGYERLAIGPEAIGYCGNTQYINLSWRDEEYRALLNEGKFPISCSINLSYEQQLRRKILLGFQNLVMDGYAINKEFEVDIFSKYQETWDLLVDKGMIDITDGQISVLKKGKKVLYHIQTLFYEDFVEVKQKGVAGVIIKESDHVDEPVL